MKAILSILICLAMMVSGLAFAEPAETLVSKCVSIDNAVVKLDGKTYELPLALVYGIRLDPATGETLIDFRLDYQDEALFPLQAKLASDGMSLLIGKSKTAYTFDAALLEGSELDYEMFMEYLRNVGDLVSNYSGSFPSPKQSAAVAEILNRALSAQEEDATYENQPAKRRSGTLDTDQLFSLADELLNVYSPGMSSTVAGYIDMLNMDAASDEEATAERADSLAALAKKADIALTCDYDRIDTESGAGKLDLTFRLATPDSHEKEIGFPIEVLFTDSNSGTIRSAYTAAECDGKDYVTLSGAFDATGWNYALAMTDEEGSTLSANMDSHQDEAGLVQINSAFAFNLLGDKPTSMSYTLDGTVDAAYNADYRLSLAVTAEPVDFAMDFHASMQDGAVEDRIASAKEKRFATNEDLENGASMLLMRLASLAGDVETLMNDSAITEMADAFNEMTASYYAELYPASPDQKTREDMPFTVPEFTYLPEGFELITERYNTYTLYGAEDEGIKGDAMLRYDLPTEKNEDADVYELLFAGSGIRIDIDGPIGENTQYSLDADGKLVEADQPTIESPKITVLSDIEYTIEFDYENVSYCFYVYNNALPIEDVPTFLAGIVWPEATNP